MWVGRDRLPGGPRASSCYQKRSKYSISFKKPNSTAARQPALPLKFQASPPAVLRWPDQTWVKLPSSEVGRVSSLSEPSVMSRSKHWVNSL